MDIKRFVAVMLTMVIAVCSGLMSITVHAVSDVWAIEVPGNIVSTEQIVLPDGWEFTDSTELGDVNPVTVKAYNADKGRDVDVIITRLSDDSSANDKGFGGKDNILLPQHKDSSDAAAESASGRDSAVGANDGDMQALPTASDDDGLPITGASTGLASIAAALFAVAVIIWKNSK